MFQIKNQSSTSVISYKSTTAHHLQALQTVLQFQLFILEGNGARTEYALHLFCLGEMVFVTPSKLRLKAYQDAPRIVEVTLKGCQLVNKCSIA